MKVIILAAGKGSRLSELIKDKPKCLLELGNETILEREIRILYECGFEPQDIYIVGGYKYEMLEKIAPNLIINNYYEEKDNSYSLGIALEKIEEDVLILDADLCFEKELINEILNDKNENVLLSKVSDDLSESTGIVTDENGRVNAIGKQYLNTGYVYISIFKVSKQIISEFKERLLSERSEKTWYPLAITELCSKYSFYNHVTQEKWHEIDFPEDYYETLKMFGLE